MSFIDVTDQICEGQVCRAARSGMILYRDDNHLTGTFARSLAPALVPKLRSLMNASVRARVPAL